MKIINTNIKDVKILEPTIYSDPRGCFFESFNKKKFESILNLKINFVQDNHSVSKKGVLRGLHYQLPPYAQAKLVRVVVGEIFDVAVDIRKNSNTFGAWVGEFLSSDNKKQLWIPEGFAHGFLTVSDVAEVLYKTTTFYNKDAERIISWKDDKINIIWPFKNKIYLSDKDNSAINLRISEVF